ncbi:hypothetical protein TrLO_g939 [Triparma laevis f. longispina]|uniref:Uncharacterized protein n=1 Tax=Triparma laevis f. longispina TaxID=1714387 RepID=A0A9W7FKR2_9STRA|nr:hypothetical protein TrLO_g939 [Triparma laevis f. longispina]
MASIDSMDSDEFAALLHMSGSLNPDQARANIENLHVAVIKVLGWAGGDKDNIEELAEQFDSVVANSEDVVEAVSAWFDKSVPTQEMTEEQKEGFKVFLINVARRNRTAKKMVRVSVAWKLVMTLSFGYFDVLTDLLVAKSCYDAGDLNTAYTTAGFAVLAIVIQAVVTFYQYAKSKRVRCGRPFVAFLGLGPLMEEASVWTGKEDDDLLLKGPVIYATMKAIEIGGESIPESIIQIGRLLKQDYDDIKIIQIIGVISSVMAGAFIMTDGNFGFILGKYLQSPGDPELPHAVRGKLLLKFCNAFEFVNMSYFEKTLFALRHSGGAAVAAVSDLTEEDVAEVSKEEFEELGEEARAKLQEKFASKFRKYFKFGNKSLKAAAKEWCEDSSTTETKYGRISGWDTPEVASMKKLFCAWDVYNVYEAAKQFNDDISRWNVDQVESMFCMFGGAGSFN